MFMCSSSLLDAQQIQYECHADILAHERLVEIARSRIVINVYVYFVESSKETLLKPPIEEVMATGSLESQKGRSGRVGMKK